MSKTRLQVFTHRVIRERIKGLQLDNLIREQFAMVDEVLQATKTDNTIKINRMSIYIDEETESPTVVKCVYARGLNEQAITITVPKPHWESHALCGTCEGVGWEDPNRMILCGACHGLGYVEIHEPQPIGNL